MDKRYVVRSWRWEKHPDPTMKGQLTTFTVEDITITKNFDDLEARIAVAVFKISTHHDEKFQFDCAEKLCEYLNTKNEVIQKAISDNALIQKIML